MSQADTQILPGNPEESGSRGEIVLRESGPVVPHLGTELKPSKRGKFAKPKVASRFWPSRWRVSLPNWQFSPKGLRFSPSHWLWLGGGLVLVVAYIFAAALMGHGVTRGTSVMGVPIGTMSASDAEAKLQRELPARLASQMTLNVDDQHKTADPGAFGLAVDYTATVR